MTNRKPLLCLDFDGVLHSYTSGWKAPEEISDPPVPGAQEFVRAALEHFHVVIHSARCFYSEGRVAMRAWLYAHGFPLLEISIWESPGKPPAHVTLDDRVVCFTGQWPAVEDLLAFRPWYVREGPGGLLIVGGEEE